MPVSATMKNLLHLPVMSRIPSVHPAPMPTGLAGLSQSSMSMSSASQQHHNHHSQHQESPQNRSATLSGPLMGAASMGDLKQTKISTIVSKKANRAKEIFLQNLGKAEKTKDELFEMYQANFYKQQSHAIKLHKEIKNYIHCLRTMQEATRSLNICLQESHGKDSPRHDLFCENIAEIEQMHEQLSEKLKSNVLTNIEEYLGRFNEAREKIAKRGRKLIDYDSAKRSYELLQAANNKKPLRDETRLSKSREQYEQAKQMYQNLNNELHNELPALYESRIPYILLTLQTYCSTQINFHQTNAKLYASCHDTIDLLATLSSSNTAKQHQLNQHQLNGGGNSIGGTINNNNNNNMNNSNNNNSVKVFQNTKPSVEYMNGGSIQQQQQQQQLISDNNNQDSNVNGQQDASSRRMSSSASSSLISEESSPLVNGNSELQQQKNQVDRNSILRQPETSPTIPQINDTKDKQAMINESENLDQSTSNHGINGNGKVQEAAAFVPATARTGGDGNKSQQQQNGNGIPKQPQSIPSEATTSDLPDGVLYKVKTSYKYMAEDVDELCFEADEILHVIEYEDPQEQEEGWLMGIREINGQRGLFPANFTRPI